MVQAARYRDARSRHSRFRQRAVGRSPSENISKRHRAAWRMCMVVSAARLSANGGGDKRGGMVA